ncbi:hypothetical protein QOT17_007933 [Balamuthia mandrillaris]
MASYSQQKAADRANTMTAAGIRVNGFDGRTGSTIARACIDGILLYGAKVYLPCKSALKRMEQLGWPTLHQIWRAKRAKFLWKTAATSSWNTFHGTWFFSCILRQGSWWKETVHILGERLAHMCLHDVPWASVRDELQRMNRSEDSHTLSQISRKGRWAKRSRETSWYLDSCNGLGRSVVARLRTGSLPLARNNHHFSTTGDTTCQMCHIATEDEQHFLKTCPSLRDIHDAAQDELNNSLYLCVRSGCPPDSADSCLRFVAQLLTCNSYDDPPYLCTSNGETQAKTNHCIYTK